MALSLGLFKEAFDLELCKRISGHSLLTSIKEKHCRSAYQSSDFEDNQQGLQCPARVPCDVHCEGLFGERDPAPGPFYP
jgi:hypothetical protein